MRSVNVLGVTFAHLTIRSWLVVSIKATVYELHSSYRTLWFDFDICQKCLNRNINPFQRISHFNADVYTHDYAITISYQRMSITFFFDNKPIWLMIFSSKNVINKIISWPWALQCHSHNQSKYFQVILFSVRRLMSLRICLLFGFRISELCYQFGVVLKEWITISHFKLNKIVIEWWQMLRRFILPLSLCHSALLHLWRCWFVRYLARFHIQVLFVIFEPITFCMPVFTLLFGDDDDDNANDIC